MKKLIGYIGAYGCYYIGDFFCKIGYLKINKDKYLYDFLPNFMGTFIFNRYHSFMFYSGQIQDWAKLDKPWTNVENNK